MLEKELKTKLLELMRSHRYLPMRKRSLSRELDISDSDYPVFRKMLERLVESGEIVELKKGKFGLPFKSDKGSPKDRGPQSQKWANDVGPKQMSGKTTPPKIRMPSRDDLDEDEDSEAEFEDTEPEEKELDGEMPDESRLIFDDDPQFDEVDEDEESDGNPFTKGAAGDAGERADKKKDDKKKASDEEDGEGAEDSEHGWNEQAYWKKFERKAHPEKKKDQNEPPKAPKGSITGRIEIKRAGMGFLISEPPGNDIFIPPDATGGALTGDLVAVEMKRQPFRAPRGRKPGGLNAPKPVGRVVRVLERAHPTVIGTFYFLSRNKKASNGFIGHVIPDTPGIFNDIPIREDGLNGAEDGYKVAITLEEYKEDGGWKSSGVRPIGKIERVFGPAGQADADIAAIVANYNVKTEIPEAVLREAEAIPEEISQEELDSRIFYEHPVTFTIDPADARDHDDAVALRKESNGTWTLLVHIADVSHYVKEGSLIDREARERATSVYLPGRVYPMLPPKLSNNVCSLKEGQLRLTKTARMTFSSDLRMTACYIDRSAIRSAAFLTYDQVKQGLDDNKPELLRTPEIMEACKLMKDFAGALRKKRLAAGSLDLEMPESKLLLDEKLEVKGWAEVEHHWAHELIEDMMLAANRAVAEFLVENEIPGLFRVHEDPDEGALARFAEFCTEFGIILRPPFDRVKLRGVLEKVKGKEYANTIHMALLTSLKQAKYNAECYPHYALNFSRYLHFTSPIRRYPDTIVHRELDRCFQPGQKTLAPREKGEKSKGKRDSGQKLAELRSIASHCSHREREAAAAEQEVIKFRQMEFLRKNMKESHPGVITRVKDFGLFIELQDCFVRGLVSAESLNDDWYEYIEEKHMIQGKKKGRTFQLGDKVNVKIVNIDLGKKEVDLEII